MECRLTLITSSKSQESVLDRAASVIEQLIAASGAHCDMIWKEARAIDGMDDTAKREVLTAIRASGYPGKAAVLLTPPILHVVITSSSSLVETRDRTLPARVIQSAKLTDPLKGVLAEMLHGVIRAEATAFRPPQVPSRKSNWNWLPDDWIEPMSGPGAETCYCRVMARKMLVEEMRAGRAGRTVDVSDLLPDVSDNDVENIIRAIRNAMECETHDAPQGMQRELTKSYGRSEQIAYFTAMRVANHSAALKLIKTFPGDERAVKLAKELDPWADF
ncbi:hypothetical protein M0R72_05830 [Candidatus Pacearchaeota archaeon]|jgi:hypothetical protein|nr:hypothetical protein [Candidatus Pacearchaeota archaeon]